MSSPDIVVLSDNDSDSDVAIVGSCTTRAARLSTSPVFIRASRTADVYTLVDTDTDSDSEDIDSILARPSARRHHKSPSSPVKQSNALGIAQTGTGHGNGTSSTSASSSRRRSVESETRSILSVLESGWDNNISNAATAVSPKPQQKRRKTCATIDEEGTAQSKAREREAAREERSRQKSQERQERQRARDELKAAKEAERSYQKKLKEVNRLRKTKSEALRELEIHMAHDLTMASSPIAGAMPEIRRRVEDSLSKIVTIPESETVVGGTIRFLRHVTADWDASAKRFVPLDTMRKEWETTTILVASADEIVDRVIRGNGELEEWIADVRLTLFLAPEEQLLLLVRGLEKYHSKTRSEANKAFRDSARAGLANGRTRSTAAHKTRVEKDEVESELLKAQLSQSLLVVQVEKSEDIEDWIFNLAGDIAAKPYKLLEKSHLPFSPPDHPRKAVEPSSAMELMLQEVNGLTASAAMGIVSQYPSFRKLMEAYEGASDLRTAEDLLKDCEIRNSKNGAAASRRVGPSLSRKVHWLFRGQDPLALQ